MKKTILSVITILTIAVSILSCAVKKREYVMPFYNGAYNALRLLPIALSETDVAARIWINNGTSVERVISISKDSVFNREAYLDEIGNLFPGPEIHPFINRTKISPKSGFDAFFLKLDSMKIFEIESQKQADFPPIAIHSPFSLYVIEIKKQNRYHSFKFYTAFPQQSDTNTMYEKIEKLIHDEFQFSYYFDK